MKEKKNSSSSKKSKKRKNSDSSNDEEHEDLKYLKNKKMFKEEKEIIQIDDDTVKKKVNFQSCLDEHQNVGSQKEFDGDSWNKEDCQELIRRMESQVPTHDTITFSKRADKLDWSQIQFKRYSEENCREKWKELRKRVRNFRLLKEVLEDVKTYIESPWKTILKKKRARHPEEPTRPLSSYMLFYMDKKDEIFRKFPNLKLTEITRLIGGEYKALSEEHKSYYIEKAREMQEEYKKNLAKFYEKHPEYIKVTDKKVSKTKKPCTPFKLYLQDKLLKHQNDQYFNQHEFQKRYKEVWKTLSTKKKAYWISLARDEQNKYLKLLQEDLSGDESKPALPHRSIITKEENAILDRIAGKPEKPPNSAYTLFSRLMLQNKGDHINGDPKNRMKDVANLWKELPNDQKKAYAERVQHMNETFKLEFANYLDNLPEEKREEELAKIQPKRKVVNVKLRTTKESTKPKSTRQGILNNEPEKPPQTAWDLFKKKYFTKNSHLPSEVAFKNAATLWKTLSPKGIEKYKKKYEKIKEKYMVDFEAFLKSLNEEQLREYYSRNQSGAESEDTDNDLESSSEDSKDDDGSDDNSDAESIYSESDSGVSDEGY